MHAMYPSESKTDYGSATAAVAGASELSKEQFLRSCFFQGQKGRQACS